MNNIIVAILSGNDYRPFVLETINRRFVENVHAILLKVFNARQMNSQSDWWRDELIMHSQKRDVLWFTGLNNKTVVGMAGSTAKEVCVRLGNNNLDSVRYLIDQFTTADVPHVEITISYRGEAIRLTEGESVLVMNAVATMKLAIQGGAWSEVGKKVEKRLLFIMFELLRIPPSQYVLVYTEMKKRGLVDGREIDAVVFTDDNAKSLRIELKLLAGNPEIGDEAFAREVDLYLVDRSSPTMIEDGKKHGVTTIELRSNSALLEVADFFRNNGIMCSSPDVSDIAAQVASIGKHYDEKREKDRVLQAAKRLVGT